MAMSAPHVDVASYVLGILDEADEVAFARHFTTCASCRAEYRELSDLPRLLDQVKSGSADPSRTSAAATTPSKDLLGDVLTQINWARGRQRTMMWLAVAAAAVLLVVLPLMAWKSAESPTAQGGVPLGTLEPAPTSTSGTAAVAGAHVVQGSDPETGVSANIAVQPESWGTRVDLELRGVSGPMDGLLVAVSRSGYSQVVTSWRVPEPGFGVPGAPEPLRVRGGVGFTETDIERFDVRSGTGHDLIRVPA
jgi:hypothetical protein